MKAKKMIETDILVIGGGIAGCFAAINAREEGAQVTLVDKGYVSRSGQTPFAFDLLVFNPDWGHDFEKWMDQVYRLGEYINNQEWTEITFKESYAIYKDLLSWGVTFKCDKNGIPKRTRLPGGVTEFIKIHDEKWPTMMRNKAIEVGVHIIDRVMIAELLKQDNRIVGAVGIPVDEDIPIVFNVGAVIMSVGAAGFKPNGFPISNLTADGEAMAYRAGAEISGKEFQDPHWTSAQDPASGPPLGPPKDDDRISPDDDDAPKWPPIKFIDAAGNEMPGRPEGSSKYHFAYMDLEFQAHEGKGPFYVKNSEGMKVPIVGGGSLGMSVRKADGIYPIDTNCASSVLGLYAAGDTCSTMASGTVYSTMGSCLIGGAVTGTRAAKAAAKYVVDTRKVEIAEEEIQRGINFVWAPMQRTGGFSPKWVIDTLKNAMMPYYILYIKKEDRLKATLTHIEFMRDHLVPKLFVKDMHELRLAHEARNMVLNAEAKLRASLFRKESRGCHYREDFPSRNDEEWLAWILIKEKNGKMELIKKPIPEAWKPDMSVPYAMRYPYILPYEKRD